MKGLYRPMETITIRVPCCEVIEMPFDFSAGSNRLARRVSMSKKGRKNKEKKQNEQRS